MSAIVFMKVETSNLSVSVNLLTFMNVGESILLGSLTVSSVSPVSTPPLVLTVSTVSASSFVGTLSGGKNSLSYGVKVDWVTNTGRPLSVTLAVVVRNDFNVPYATKNPYAYQSLVGDIEAGDAAVGKGFFILPPEFDAGASYVTWSLMDREGSVFANGNAYDLSTSRNSYSLTIESNAVVHIPSDVPPSLDGQKYQLRWELHTPGMSDMYAYESISVVGVTSVPIGPQDTVEVQGDIASISLVTADLYDNVGLEIFNPSGNAKAFNFANVVNPKRVSTGWYHVASVDTSSLQASVLPYVVSWKYWNSATPSRSSRETSRIFVVNGSILNAIEDTRMMVNKAKTTLFNFADMMFDTTTLIGFLRRGMDMFNGSGGYMTTFDMTDATGGIRDFWLGYSEVAMLQAQALAEGEKAFDFQGQAIQLTVDRTQYYQQMADTLLNRLEANARQFKQNLATKGISGGTGNVNSAGRGNVPFVGITIHPASHFGRYYNNWNI